MYITQSQWIKINSFLTNQKISTPEQKKELNKMIYFHYKKWAIHQAYEFKKFHNYKCNGIKQTELNLYSSLGLIKAIQKYDPYKCVNTTFSVYASKYIMGELYNGMTQLQPTSLLEKSDRKKKYYKRNTQSKYNVHPILLGNNDFLIDNNQLHNSNSPYNKYDKYDYNSYKKYEYIWSMIESMDIPIIMKKIIKLKLSFDFKKIRSNKEISEILCYNEETIRQNIVEFKEKMYNVFSI
jgi:hypothetical protein